MTQASLRQSCAAQGASFAGGKCTLPSGEAIYLDAQGCPNVVPAAVVKGTGIGKVALIGGAALAALLLLR